MAGEPERPTNIFLLMAEAEPEVLDAIAEGLRPFAQAVTGPAPKDSPKPANIFALMADADPALMDTIIEGVRPFAQAANGPAPAPQPKS